ncbi:hypothetical protein CesoFtcFv8_001275 [Champsocephalus esox]|uniref:Uncharacterized protein n=1 Tax=Champsocephalus esox TaxID=159716 RepID=A0AAN8HGR8_9TELE|nr:hypothetical protein CesoFtcFv8_001275 [Champsocephalus esox]
MSLQRCPNADFRGLSCDVGKTATALLESLQDDYIGTREEEHSRTTVDKGSVHIVIESRTDPSRRIDTNSATNTECHHDTAACGSRQEETRRRGSGPAGTAP